MTRLLLAVLIVPLPARPALGAWLEASTVMRSVYGGQGSLSTPPAGSAPSAAHADTTAGSIAGRLSANGSGPPLASATVEAQGPGGSRVIHANVDGVYRILGLKPGVWWLSARALDYASTKVAVTLPAGGHVKLNLALDLQPVTLPSLKVAAKRRCVGGTLRIGNGNPLEAAQAADLLSLSPASASATVDLSTAARGVLAGAPQTKASTLFMPAAARNGGRVLLDGAPVVAPVELAGLLSPFPAGVWGTVQLDRAGAPVRFEAGGMGLLRLDTREPRGHAIRASGSLGQLQSTLQAAGPLGEGDFLVGARALSAAGSAFPTGSRGSLPYGYADVLARLDLPAGPGRVSATGYWNRESLSGPGSASASLLAWGNTAGSVRYVVPIGRGGMRLNAAAGRFRIAVPGGNAEAKLREHSFDARAEAEVFGRAGPVDVTGGLAWDGVRLSRTALDSADGAPPVPGANLAGGVVSPYLEVNVDLTPALSLRTGLRAEAASYGALGWDPRATLEWRAGPRLSVYAAAGRSHQLVERESVTGCDPASGVCGASSLFLDGASHVAAGFKARPSVPLTLGLDMYLANYGEAVTALRARSIGAEIRGTWRGDGWSTWLDYSLASTRSSEPLGIGGGAAQLEQRLLAGFSAEIPPAIHVALRLRVSAGLPYTPLPIVGSTSSAGAGSGYPWPVISPPGSGGQPSALALPGSWARLDGTVSRSSARPRLRRRRDAHSLP